jgi:hypothetical protein
MKAARHCVLDITVLGAPAGYRPIGGDWRADLAMTVLVGLWILFPQDSGDKLALWRDAGLGRNREAFRRSRPPQCDRTRRDRPRHDRSRRDPRAAPGSPQAFPAPPHCRSQSRTRTPRALTRRPLDNPDISSGSE